MDDNKPLKKFGKLSFKFRINPEAPHGKVAVAENGHMQFLVMARDDLTDAQVIMAIAQWVALHKDDLDLGL